MDRVVLLVVVLGVLLGCIQALSIQAREGGLSYLPGAQLESARTHGAGLLTQEDYKEAAAPDGPDWKEETFEAEDVAGLRNALDGAGQSEFFSDDRALPDGPPAVISTDQKGVTASYPETETRYVFSEHTLALVTLASGGDRSEVEGLVEKIGGVVAERLGKGLLLVIPVGSADLFDDLMERGIIVSLEEGGWGSGLGKA